MNTIKYVFCKVVGKNRYLASACEYDKKHHYYYYCSYSVYMYIMYRERERNLIVKHARESSFTIYSFTHMI